MIIDGFTPIGVGPHAPETGNGVVVVVEVSGTMQKVLERTILEEIAPYGYAALAIGVFQINQAVTVIVFSIAAVFLAKAGQAGNAKQTTKKTAFKLHTQGTIDALSNLQKIRRTVQANGNMQLALSVGLPNNKTTVLCCNIFFLANLFHFSEDAGYALRVSYTDFLQQFRLLRKLLA